MKLALSRYWGFSLKALSIYDVINPKEFALIPKEMQQRLTSCEELLQANVNLNGNEPRTWAVQDVAQFGTLVEELNELVIESIRNPETTVGPHYYRSEHMRELRDYPLGKAILYLFSLGNTDYDRSWFPVLINVRLASTQIKHSFSILKAHFTFLQESFRKVLLKFEQLKQPELEQRVVFLQIAVMEVLGSFATTGGFEAIADEDYCYIAEYLDKAIRSIEKVFFETQLQALEQEEQEEQEEVKAIRLCYQFDPNDTKKSNSHFVLFSRHFYMLDQMLLQQHKLCPKAQNIAEFICRFSALLQLKTLKLKPYLTGAVIDGYAELPGSEHRGTANRSGGRQFEKLVELGLDFYLECLDDMPKLIGKIDDYNSFVEDGGARVLLAETKKLLTQITPEIIDVTQCLVRDLYVYVPEEELHPMIAKHTKDLARVMIRALEAINATLEVAFQKFTAFDFDRFVTRWFAEIPLNLFVGAASTFIDAVKAKTGLSFNKEMSFSTRLVPVAPLAAPDASVYSGASAFEKELPV